MYHCLTLILFFAIALDISAQESKTYHSYLDSIESLNNQGKYEQIQPIAENLLDLGIKNKNDTIQVIARYYYSISFFRNDLNRAIVEMQQTKEASLHVNNYKLLNVLDALAIFFRRSGNYKSSIETCHTALNYLKSNPDPLKEFDLFRNLARNFRELKAYDSAFYYLILAENSDVADWDEINKYMVKQSLANLYEDLGEFEQANSTLQELIEIATSLDRQDFLATSTMNLGINFLKQNKPDSALITLQASREITQDPYTLSEVLSSMGAAYEQKGNIRESVEYYQQAFEFAKQTGSLYDQALISSTLGGLFFSLARYPEAERQFHYSYSLARKNGYLDVLEKCYYGLYELNLAKENTSEALDYYIQFHSVSDSLKNENRMTALDDLKTKYETEKKQNEIESLRKQSQIQQLTIRQNNIIAISSILILVVILVIIFLIYRQRIQRQRMRTLESDQRLLRAQMNPHFFFNALTSIQTLLLETQSIPKSTNYLARFAKLMRRTLESSREDLIPISEEISLLENYLMLQSLRFEEKFDYHIACDEALKAYYIPPMLGQPMIENALEHGLKGLDRSGLIEIKFSKIENSLLYQIEDNGVGISKRSPNQDHISMASRITEDRIRLIQNQTKSTVNWRVLELKSKTGNVTGTQVQFQLPLIT